MQRQPGAEINLQQISTALSRAKVDDAIEAPTVTQLEKEAGTETILAVLMFELEKINAMFNSNERLKLSHEQCADISIMLLDEFPHESLEDFVLAFRKGITGKYDDKLLRIDVQVIFHWVRAWLDEKAERNEVRIKNAKVVPPVENKAEQEFIDKLVKESWVGKELNSQVKDADAFRKFKANYLTNQAAKNEKKETPPIK